MYYNSLKCLVYVFIIWSIIMYGIGFTSCSCKFDTGLCNRYEFYGVQFNHFLFYLFLGYFFPSYFYLTQIMGIIWEVFEYYLEQHEEFAKKYFGGCLSKKPENIPLNPPYFYKVYKDIPKYQNPIDKTFNIRNSTTITWHGSIAEIIPNILGFLVGAYIHKYLNT